MEGDPHKSAGHEPEQVSTGRVGLWAAALSVVVIVIIVIMVRFYQRFQVQEAPEGTVVTVSERPPGGFRNWKAPRRDLQVLRTEEDRRLHSYEWIDRKQGIVRIPIDRAMRLVAEQAQREQVKKQTAGNDSEGPGDANE